MQPRNPDNMRRKSDWEKDDKEKEKLSLIDKFYKHEGLLMYFFLAIVILPGAGYVGWKVAQIVNSIF